MYFKIITSVFNLFKVRYKKKVSFQLLTLVPKPVLLSINPVNYLVCVCVCVRFSPIPLRGFTLRLSTIEVEVFHITWLLDGSSLQTFQWSLHVWVREIITVLLGIFHGCWCKLRSPCLQGKHPLSLLSSHRAFILACALSIMW